MHSNKSGHIFSANTHMKTVVLLQNSLKLLSFVGSAELLESFGAKFVDSILFGIRVGRELSVLHTNVLLKGSFQNVFHCFPNFQQKPKKIKVERLRD